MEFLGYEVLITWDDYDNKEVFVKDLNEVYEICENIYSKDEFFEVNYRKKYKYNDEILYGETKKFKIKNTKTPKLYESKLRDVKVGKNVVVVKPSNLYECELKDNVFIGPFVEIQKGVVIGENTRVQSHTFICELVTIGKNCFIGHGVMFVNDLFSEGGPSGDRSKWKETIIEDNVSIGSNATILPVRICSNVVIGAGSVVTKDIITPGIYVGNPARKLRDL